MPEEQKKTGKQRQPAQGERPKRAKGPAEKRSEKKAKQRREDELLLAETSGEETNYVGDKMSERDFSPVRSSREYRSGCLGGLMFFVFIVCVSVVFAALAWMAASDTLALNKETFTATVTLPASAFETKTVAAYDKEGNQTGTERVTVADIDYVASALKEAGLIEYKWLFSTFCKMTNADGKIDPGSYELRSSYDYRALVNHMRVGAGASETVLVTLPEGFTMRQMFKRLEENGVCKAEDLMEAAATYQYNYSFDTDYFGTDNIGSGYALKDGMADMSSYRSDSRYIAFFGRVMYNYGDKYLASVSLRRDGSSRFGSQHKWGWFPAVSLGWRITQENFMKNVSWLEELKLRAGYGVTGNQDFDNYRSLFLMATSGLFYSNGKWYNTYVPASNANPDLGWEKKSEFNIGIDWSVLKGRLGGTIDYYYRLTTDLLYDYAVPVPPYDYKSFFTNVGAISNSGIEVTINAIPVKTNDWEWNTTLIFSKNANKLIKFTNEEFQGQEYRIGWVNTPLGVYTQRLEEGKSLGSFYGPEFLGTDKETGNAMVSTDDENEWKWLGSAYPDFNLGWSNSVSWKNLSLSATFRAAIGGKVLNQMRGVYENITNMGLQNIQESWLYDQDYTGGVVYSSKYLEDATYLKLDNISLTYSIPLENKYVKGIRVYATAQNVFVLTGYTGVDPEVSLSGLAPGIAPLSYYPRTRSFTLGASITF